MTEKQAPFAIFLFEGRVGNTTFSTGYVITYTRISAITDTEREIMKIIEREVRPMIQRTLDRLIEIKQEEGKS